MALSAKSLNLGVPARSFVAVLAFRPVQTLLLWLQVTTGSHTPLGADLMHHRLRAALPLRRLGGHGHGHVVVVIAPRSLGHSLGYLLTYITLLI